MENVAIAYFLDISVKSWKKIDILQEMNPKLLPLGHQGKTI
jgi:hypothetical protein